MPEFTISPATRIGAVHLTVPDLRKAMRFYGDILGFWAVDRQDGRVSLASSSDGRPPIITLVERADAQPRPPHTTGLYHYAMLLPSRAHLARTLLHLSESRYPLQGAADHLVSEALYLADLDGNGIEIYADRPRSLWPQRNGQIAMATDPLDVESLMAESEEDDLPWEGMPADTVVGHVHLQVSDVALAERFYREVLGFELTQRFGHSAAFLSAGGYHHHIGLNSWGVAGGPPAPPESIGLRYFALCLPSAGDVEVLLQRVAAAGVQVEEEAGGHLLYDPSRNGILLSAPATNDASSNE